MKVGDRVHTEFQPEIKGTVVEVHPDWSYPVSVLWDGHTKIQTYSASRLRVVPVIDLLADLSEEG